MATQEIVKKAVDQEIEHNHILVLGKSTCPYTKKAREALDKVTPTRKDIDLDREYPNDSEAIENYLRSATGNGEEGPKVFIHGKFVGGGDKIAELQKTGQLKKLIDSTED